MQKDNSKNISALQISSTPEEMLLIFIASLQKSMEHQVILSETKNQNPEHIIGFAVNFLSHEALTWFSPAIVFSGVALSHACSKQRSKDSKNKKNRRKHPTTLFGKEVILLIVIKIDFSYVFSQER